MKFIINNEKKTKKILNDIEQKTESNLFFNDDISYDFLLCMYKEVSYLDRPLFLEKEKKEDYFKFNNNVKLLKDLLKKEINNDYSDSNEEDYSLQKTYNEKLSKILDGTYVFATLEENFIYLDYKKYNFKSLLDMFYSLGAYISNKIDYQDPKEELFFYKDNLYIYNNNIHGDFRLTSYQIPDKKICNPENKDHYLPFKVPEEVGKIIGYHSVEHNFLAGLLKYVKDNNIDSYIYKNFYKVVDKKIKLSEIENGKENININYSSLIGISNTRDYYPVISAELHNLHYEFKEEKNNLAIYEVIENKNHKKVLEVEPESIDLFLNGLLEKSLKGNGRETIQLLRKTYEYFHKS
tara:strand:+ start:871 stop:1923 length:1053 start_codon:yes stop_codon:yes gene_type:complete